MKPDRTYINLYNNRCSGTREAWLDSSKTIIRTHYYGANKDIRAAAESLSRSCTFDQARALAYSAYCFWYQPLLDHANKHEHLYNHDSGRGMSWMMNDIFRKALRGEQDSQISGVIKRTTEYLDLATTAFQTALHFAKGYRKFQQDMFAEVAVEIAGDTKLFDACQMWPRLVDKNCCFVDGALQGDALNPASVSDLKKLNIHAFLEHSSTALLRAASKVRPDIYSDHPTIKAVLFDPSYTSGTYGYGAGVSSYFFNESTPWAFITPVNALVGGVHETEHIAQYHLVKGMHKLSGSDELLRAALLFRDNVDAQRPRNKDGAVSLYSVGLSDFQPLVRAYEARPLEAFAWRMDALGFCLAEAWGQPFYAWDKPSFADLKSIGRKALGLEPR